MCSSWRDDSGVSSRWLHINTLQPLHARRRQPATRALTNPSPGRGCRWWWPSLLYYHLFIIVITIVKRNWACDDTVYNNNNIIYFGSAMTFGYRFGSIKWRRNFVRFSTNLRLLPKKLFETIFRKINSMHVFYVW